MCGRYQLDDDMKAIIERFDIESIFSDHEARIGEIFPSDRAPVVCRDGGANCVKVIRWGIRPFFMNKDIINVRRESLFNKKMFDRGILEGRCIIPANYFYEWEKAGTGRIKRKIYVEGQSILALAGMIMSCGDPDTGRYADAYSIITKNSEGVLLMIHERMPVILKKEDEDAWLDRSLLKEDIEQLIERSVSAVKIA